MGEVGKRLRCKGRGRGEEDGRKRMRGGWEEEKEEEDGRRL